MKKLLLLSITIINSGSMNKAQIAAGIIIVILVIGIALLMSKPSTTSITTSPTPPAATGLLTFQLIDPPQVPNNTQALVITYSSLSAHVLLANGTSEWFSSSDTGSVNLLSLVNISQVIGSVNIPKNSTVDMVKFNITSATITIDNKTYNVTVPSQQITVHISNVQRVNGTASALIDITPVVASIYTNNSVIFVLVPSLRAVVVPGSASATVGAKVAINETERHELESIRPNITISSISLSESNNITSLRVSVVNNANTSVVIKHVLLFGNESIYINTSSARVSIEEGILHIEKHLNDTSMQVPGYGVNLVNLGNLNNITLGNAAKIFGINQSSVIGVNGELNISANASTRLSVENISKIMEKMHDFDVSEKEFSNILSNGSPAFNSLISSMGISNDKQIEVSIEAEHFRVIDFIATQNGTLILPFVKSPIVESSSPDSAPGNLTGTASSNEGEDITELEHEFSNGYTIPAHGSATLTFNGEISFANGHIVIAVIPGEQYKVVVVGTEDSHASSNTIAS
jgi:hypothetical protein